MPQIMRKAPAPLAEHRRERAQGPAGYAARAPRPRAATEASGVAAIAAAFSGSRSLSARNVRSRIISIAAVAPRCRLSVRDRPIIAPVRTQHAENVAVMRGIEEEASGTANTSATSTDPAAATADGSIQPTTGATGIRSRSRSPRDRPARRRGRPQDRSLQPLSAARRPRWSGSSVSSGHRER